MKARGALKRLQQQHPNLEQVIPVLVNEKGQSTAAKELGISQATISRWLRRHHYEPMTTWRKVT